MSILKRNIDAIQKLCVLLETLITETEIPANVADI